MIPKGKPGIPVRAAAVLLLLLLCVPSCGRKAKPEPKWGAGVMNIPFSAAGAVSAAGSSAR